MLVVFGAIALSTAANTTIAFGAANAAVKKDCRPDVQPGPIVVSNTSLSAEQKGNAATIIRVGGEMSMGDYAKQILANAKVDTGALPPKSLEANVKGVVTKVTSGSVDAGIVYVTDGKAASSTSETIDIPDDINVIANYPIARLKQSGHADVAAAFIDFILSATGQNILGKYGFLPLS